MKIENNMTMKMKLNPELSCLEVQEKFWRGRFKEIDEKFTEERKKMEILIAQITAENEQLKNDLNNLSSNSLKCSVSVQTSQIDTEAEMFCKYCQRPIVKTRTIFSKGSDTLCESSREEEKNSEFFLDKDLLLQNNTSITATTNYCNSEEYNFNVEKTITKLFSSNNHSDSQKITSKLLELYEKRSKSVPDLVYDETEYQNLHEVETNLMIPDENDFIQNKKSQKTNEIVSKDIEENPILNETPTRNHVSKTKYSKNKIRFLPKVQNIRKKVFKNLSKFKRGCTDIKMTDDDLKSCVIDSNGNVKSSNASNALENDVSNSELLLSLRKSMNGKILEEVQASPKCQLISAMKKSKSTGNIVKKVAFSDDLPSMKTVSESNLLQVNDYRFKRESDTKPLLIGSVQVHRDEFARPIPAPRSRKNIIVMNP